MEDHSSIVLIFNDFLTKKNNRFDAFLQVCKKFVFILTLPTTPSLQGYILQDDEWPKTLWFTFQILASENKSWEQINCYLLANYYYGKFGGWQSIILFIWEVVGTTWKWMAIIYRLTCELIFIGQSCFDFRRCFLSLLWFVTSCCFHWPFGWLKLLILVTRMMSNV